MTLRTQKAIHLTMFCLIGFICSMLWWGCKDPSAQNQVSVGDLSQAEMSVERIRVHLYFLDSNNSYLIAEERSFPISNHPKKLGLQILEALLDGPKQTLERAIPEGTELRGFYILENRTAYVDLSQDLRERHAGGANSELMTIYSIVNSLVLNIATIETVKILVEGREVTTLAGHVDLRYPLQANMLYVR